MAEIEQTQWLFEQMANSPYATGPDFSKHKGEWDLSTIAEEDMPYFRAVTDFIVLRVGYCAGDGVCYKDPKFDINYDIARTLGIPVLGYFYLGNASADAQFKAYVYYVGDRELDGHVSDFENMYNDMTPEFARTHIEFMESLMSQYPGKRVMTYANVDHYEEYLHGYVSAVDDYPLWVAHWPWYNWVSWDKYTDFQENSFREYWEKVFAGERTPDMPLSRPYNDWEIWQMVANSGFGHEFGFGSDALDFNITRRTKEDFYAWLGYETNDIPEEPEEEDEDMENNEELIAAMEEVSTQLAGVEAALRAVTDVVAGHAMIMNNVGHLLDQLLSGNGGSNGTGEEPGTPEEPEDPIFAWEGWQAKPKEEWPTHVNGLPVAYVFPSEDKPLWVINESDNTFTPYQEFDLRGRENTNGQRIICKAGNAIMVYAKGNQYADVKDKEVRPFYSYESERFDGGATAYLVMREQNKDGIPLWEGIPGDEEDHVVLWMPTRYVLDVYNPATGETTLAN